MRGPLLGLSYVVAGAVALLAVGSVTGLAAAATATAVPYTDPDVAGSIGLCNQAGQQVTSGSVDTVPFTWRAVSTQPASAPYNNAARRATLVVYQPLQNIPAGDWSGETLTAASSYTNPANPMAAGTNRDQSLQDIIEAFPPTWDGFLQLRIYLSTANTAPYTAKYPALDIQVTGGTWHAVGGATVNCAAGTAESMETVLLPSTTATTVPTATTAPAATTAPSKTTVPTTAAGAPGAKGTPAAAGASDPGISGSGGSGGAKSGSGVGTSGGQKSGSGTQAKGDKSAAADASTGSPASTTSNRGLIAGLIVAALLVLGLAGYLLARHRRRRPVVPPDPDASPEPIDPDVSPEPSELSDSTMTSSTMKGH
jgi:uncharacterized membrane protein YgcG